MMTSWTGGAARLTLDEAEVPAGLLLVPGASVFVPFPVSLFIHGLPVLLLGFCPEAGCGVVGFWGERAEGPRGQRREVTDLHPHPRRHARARL